MIISTAKHLVHTKSWFFLPEIAKWNLTTVSLQLQEKTDCHSPYKWLFVTMVLLCLIFGIISVTFMFKQFRRRQETVNTDVAYFTATLHDDSIRAYSSCNENLNVDMESTGNEPNQPDKLFTCTKENVYINFIRK